MDPLDDPYKLGWRFWSRYLLICLLSSGLVTLLAGYMQEPDLRNHFIGSFFTTALIFIGPALSTHYRKTPKP